MSSTDTFKRRLQSLKTLTQQLKEYTTDSPFDIAHLKNLLQSARRHFQQKGIADSDDQKLHLPRPKNSPYQTHLKQSQYNNSRTIETNNLTEEIIQLREQNLKLQQKIQALKEKINLLQNQISKGQQKLNKQQMPYFKITDQLNIFICRLQINPSDFHKVEYFQYRGQLHLDKLKLVRKEKPIEQEFDLTTLINVQYESDKVLILQFQQFIEEEPSVPTSLFIKFGQKEHLHKWDLALFTNFQIVNSLNKPKLFQPYFKLQKQEKQKIKELKKLTELRESKDLDESHQSDLLKLLIKRREQYLQIKKLVGEKMHHKMSLGQQINSEIKQLTEEKDKENSQLTDQMKDKKEQKKDLFQKQASIFQTPVHVVSNIQRQYEGNNDSQAIFNRRSNQNIVSQNNEPSSGLPFFGMSFSQGPKGQFPLTSPPFNFSPATQQQSLTTPKQDILRSSVSNNFTNLYPRTKSYQQQSRGTFMSKVRQGPQKKVTTSIQNLQTGYFAIKYSKDGFNPHPKKVFLSLDCKKFCWSDPEKQSDYKSIPMEVIRKVSYPQLGEGILKHVKNPDSRYFCIIEYLTSNYNIKTIQLGSGNLEDINNFYQDLQLFRKSSKKLELNQ